MIPKVSLELVSQPVHLDTFGEPRGLELCWKTPHAVPTGHSEVFRPPLAC